ncbi:hypothetical protein GCM10009006_30710 [Haloarcula argentinensis]|uniref:Uncharacterized protein n=1 Tax=Haloarcula argentinensis TaxID=43776 RepID=A0A830FGB6_HALAR|nr:hypothetical protein [Haloarcula argentinensis]GGM47373.1 hypothetical protein GCM10009006_30710 [Haloarcula argentinensis]
MPDSLPVHLNRTDIHSLEVPHEFDATGSFDVQLVNHGEALHVHLHLDDSLSSVASLDATNHHVRAETDRLVKITVDGDGPVRGKLKIVTGYGAETRYIDIYIPEGGTENEPVIVDDELSKPQPKPTTESEPSLEDLSAGPILAAGGFTVLIAGLITLVLTESMLLTVAAVLVVTIVLGLLSVAVRSS